MTTQTPLTVPGRAGRPGRRREPAVIVLEDGRTFRGSSYGAVGQTVGEAVFSTGMTGYQETVTDPSYAAQLVCFTAPMVGNYGVAENRGESAKPHARAALMRQLGGKDWADWLAAHGLVGLEEIDTRALVLRLRDAGAMRAVAVADEAVSPVADALDRVRAQPTMEGQSLVAAVSTQEPYVYGAGRDGEQRIRCYQIAGDSDSGEMIGWKLLRVDDIASLRVTETRFSARPDYRRADPVIVHVACQV